MSLGGGAMLLHSVRWNTTAESAEIILGAEYGN